MTTKTEAPRAAAFILSEANGARSRETVTLLGGTDGPGKIEAGTVLGQLTAGGKFVPSPATGADGSETGSVVLIYPADTTDADVEAAVIARDAEVNGALLAYDASVNTDEEKAAKAADLADAGIIVR